MTSFKFSAITRAGILATATIIAATGIQTISATSASALSSDGVGTTTYNVRHVSQSISSAEEQAVLNQINQYRAQHGIAAVSLDDNLASGARDWAAHLTNTGAPAGHPEGGNFYENVAYSMTPERAVELWKNSPGHNANLLQSNIHTGGVGVVSRADGTFTVVFRGI